MIKSIIYKEQSTDALSIEIKGVFLISHEYQNLKEFPEKLIVLISAVVTTGCFGLFFLLVGYPPVATFTTKLPIRSPPVYMLPIFFSLGSF